MEYVFKIAVLVVFGMILVSLGSGMFFLTKDGGGKDRTVRALTVRIALSILLFVLLLVGYFTGLIKPHGI